MSGFVAYPEQFRVDDHKVRRYLLDPDHAEGGDKCAFLLSIGFTVDDPVSLMAALAAHPTPHTLTRTYPTPFGHRYHFEGPLPCPDGSVANVRTVWQVDADSGPNPARFITLKPLPRSR
ncbi:hypothetical protein MMB17_22010 [Methylobacterium organophilum]|uniref:DUF6883 domain-containing protein n=1 Tax=Methylobacterium organophilum TaxID=410 RepID=UPI001F14270B|nr:DUF6883 domain-containing protein [Methylobacterium organophilum]UMY17278.1 hypothetical protein MMB17_22010 [Methylobacterium organophilum]